MSETTELILKEVQPEVGNIKTFIFENNGLEWKAGQYNTYILPQAGETEELNQRFFTIASAPSQNDIRISTRVSESSFKQALNSLQPGQTIRALTPKGSFTWQKETDQPKVLVAAGIGITPFISILRQRQAEGKNLLATLLYFNRTDEIAFKSELDNLTNQHEEFAIKYIVGEPVTAESIVQYEPLAYDNTVFISGPEPMVEAVGNDLKQKDIKVKQDWFPGYNENTY